jgi:hypothetical protein
MEPRQRTVTGEPLTATRRQVKDELIKAELTRGELTRGELTRGELTRGELTRGELTRGELTEHTFPEAYHPPPTVGAEEGQGPRPDCGIAVPLATARRGGSRSMGGQRQKRRGRVTPKRGVGGRSDAWRLTAAERVGLEQIFAELLHGARHHLTDGLEPLAVEWWASELWSVLQGQRFGDMDPVALFAGGLIDYAAGRGTPEALAVLRAVEAVAPEPFAAKARSAGMRVAAAGIREPSWADAVGQATPTEAWLTFDAVDDDGVSVMVGFEGPAGPHTLGVYIDHNLGGIAKDSFVVPATIDEVMARLSDQGDSDCTRHRQIAIGEAAARWLDGFEMTDMTREAPVTDDLRNLRAMVFARLGIMPSGGEVPADAMIGEDERRQVLADFLHSDETVGIRGVDGHHDGEVDELAQQVMTFSLDYVEGTPLRFSPVMVEIFCLDWAPRKIAGGKDSFTLLPDVLAAWIRFAGRRRGVPEQSIEDSIEAAYDFAPEMIELSQDPANWGPAKTIALGIQARGIDITDRGSLDDFVAEVNRRGGIDVLAESLASAQVPPR